ncbi:MAG: glutamate racemase [Armatimonadetes bacterium]|nr:glutamate racemase [Armatimonadota bacterium]
MRRGRIGVFDSGVGGLTVAARIQEEMPELALHYFGDTAHVPYGNRTAEDIQFLVRAIVDYLVKEGCQALVMACNTSSALALESVREWCPVPVVGIIEPAARAATALTRNGRIGLIANPLTARCGAYERAISPVVPLNQAPLLKVFPVACPKLVPLVEAGLVSGPETTEALLEYLNPLIEERIDTLILGCTHYPFLLPAIQEILGREVAVVDPAEYVVQELKMLGIRGGPGPTHRFEVSAAPLEFERVGTRLLGRVLSGVGQVELIRAQRAAAS